MSKARMCEACPHPVGAHSHIPPHMCKADKCGCWGFAREASVDAEGAK